MREITHPNLKLFLVILLAGLNNSCQNSFGGREMDSDKLFRDVKSPDIQVRRAAAETLVDLAVTSQGDQSIRDNYQMLSQVVVDNREDCLVRSNVIRALAIV